jgi:hypothetical protein
MRRLLPYEQALIDTLGITKEEYLRFLIYQEEYKDIKEGTVLDIRMGTEAALIAYISLALTLAGTAVSVLSVLLAPKPEVESAKTRGTRERRYAPRTGFDTTQELATYGEPVNLVYCNKIVNPKGGTRVNTALIWSAIESFGNSQYMRTLSALGCSGIMEIDASRTAFGQVPSRQFVGPGKWQYFANGGPLAFDDLIDGGTADPARESKAATDLIYTPGTQLTDKIPGFSQAFSPSSFNTFGIESPIAVNVEIYTRHPDGRKMRANNRVIVNGSSIYWPDTWPAAGARPQFPLNHQITLKLPDANGQNGPAKKQAAEDRLAYAASIDSSSIYKLGSAKFEVNSITGNEALNSDMLVGLVCTEPGTGPTESYGKTFSNITQEKENADRLLTGAKAEPVTNIDKNDYCRIVSVGNTDFTQLGSPNNSVGTLFKATVDVSDNFATNYGNGTVQIYSSEADANVIPIKTQLDLKRAELEANVPVMLDTSAIKEAAIQKITEHKYKIKRVANLLDYQNLSSRELDEFIEIAFGDNGTLTGAAAELSPIVNAINQHEKNISDQRKYIGTRESIRSKYANGVLTSLPLEDVFIGSYKVVGLTCKIVSVGTTNFTLMGAPDNNIGTTFTATAPGSGTGIVSVKLPLPALQEIDTFIGNAEGKIAQNQGNMKKRQNELAEGAKRLGLKNAALFDLRQTVSFSQGGENVSINIFDEVNGIINDVKAVPDIAKLNLGDRPFNRLQQVLDQRSARPGKTTIDVERNFLSRLVLRTNELEGYIQGSQQFDEAAREARNAQLVLDIAALVKRKEELQAIKDNPEIANDFLAVKGLVKITQASYETVTNCNIVKFAIKGRSFMRVQGRSTQYGEKEENSYRLADNGIKHRSSFFLMWYKYPGQEGWTLVPAIFTMRRCADNDFFFSLSFKSTTTQKWRFKFEPVFDTAAEIAKHGISRFAYVAGTKKDVFQTLAIGNETVSFNGALLNADVGGRAPRRKSPNGLDEWMLFNLNSDQNIQFSFDNGPEFEITSVTEQQQIAANYTTLYPTIYQDLSLFGFNCFSARNLRGLRSLSVFVNKGKSCKILPSSPLSEEPADPTAYANGLPSDAANYAPDVFLDTVRDAKHGIGRYSDLRGVNFRLLTQAKQMCVKNGYFMDGVIADLSSWREFWAAIAPFSLLEFARVGGQDTLIPALPVDSTGAIVRDVTISAMFNAGNILEDSYKEDFLDYGDSTQDIIANVIYKEEGAVGMEMFPRNTSVTVSLVGVTEATAVRKTFDLSQFVTTRKQALHYGMLMCQQRRHIKRSVEFKTFPSEAPVTPGSYIYVQVDENRWDSLSSGVVEAGNVLNSPISEGTINGTYRVLLYDGTSQVKSFSSITVTNGVASGLGGGYTGWLYVLGSEVTSKRVFRVVEVELAEEGEITVRAIEHPCEETVVGGALKTLSLISRQDVSLYTISD